MNNKEHWENVFEHKKETEVSWYQKTPETSIYFIKKSNLPKNAKIIDIGGGDSYLIDSLLELGYTNLFLLDISEKAIERTKKRLGEKSHFVTYIISDILDFNPSDKFDYWHDRASFHFITNKEQIKKYVDIVSNSLKDDCMVLIGTFSENGPKKCSGLDITQYSEEKLKDTFKNSFDCIECITVDHKTPFETIQNFIFCNFQKRKS